MACPFARRLEQPVRQASVADAHWIEDDLTDIPDDALALTHLQLAIQLLTAPSNDDINVAITSVIKKYSARWPGIINLKVQPENLVLYPNYDYLADIQESLLEMDEVSASEILVLLGEELITSCCSGIIERAFRCLGGDLQEFLSSLDGVYDVLKLQEEDVTDTGFVCAGEGELIFTSERPVIAWLLLGSLKALTKTLYGIDVSITIEPVVGEPKMYRYFFTQKHEQESSEEEEDEEIINKVVPSTVADLKMSPATFCKAFPWHFIMNESLELVQMGKGFTKLYKSSLPTHGRLATTYFLFKRPMGLSLKFREIVRRTNTPFLIALKVPAGRSDFSSEGLEIKGQMVFCPESNSLLFIGSPFLDGLDGLTCNGLFISDIPLHDATREVILVGEQARAQDGLRRRMDKLKSSIEEGNVAVMKERKK
ncbi:Head-specific guanylate cyclase, partial [Pseudolycoriella hygida]